jgi:hypothetical protein
MGKKEGELDLAFASKMEESATPFVFFTDTFTGKFLCDRKVGRGLYNRGIRNIELCQTLNYKNTLH